MTTSPIARVHVDDYDPEIYTGDDALLVALRMAEVFRSDFPGAVVGVSFNPAAAEAKYKIIMESLGLTAEGVGKADTTMV